MGLGEAQPSGSASPINSKLQCLKEVIHLSVLTIPLSRRVPASELLEPIHSVGLPIVPLCQIEAGGKQRGCKSKERDRTVGEALNRRGIGA